REAGRNGRTPSSFTSTSFPRAGTLRPGNSRSSFQKRFARASDRYGKVLHKRGEGDDPIQRYDGGGQMTRTIIAAALFVGLLAMPLSAGFAQTISTPVDRVLRPGDTIQWVPATPHHLQLGSAGLTPLTEVDKILTFSPAPASDAGGVRTWSAAQAVTATVKDNADMQGVANFVFTCGGHQVQMKSQPFTIESKPAGQNPRTFRIRSDPSLKWIFQKTHGG